MIHPLSFRKSSHLTEYKLKFKNLVLFLKLLYKCYVLSTLSLVYFVATSNETCINDCPLLITKHDGILLGKEFK